MAQPLLCLTNEAMTEAFPLGDLIVVGGAKGGSGKSLVATNLAIALCRTSARVALVDLDLQFGHVDLLLDELAADPAYTIADLMPVIDELTPEQVEYALQTHSTGLRVLLAPSKTSDAYAVTGQHVVRILATLRNQFDWVICDCASGADEIALAAIYWADLLLLVVTADLPCLRGTQRFVELVRQRQTRFEGSWLTGREALFRGEIGLILNQWDRSNPITPKEIEERLGLRLWAKIPVDSRAVWRNVTQGLPMVVTSPHGAGDALRRLADTLVRARRKPSPGRMG
jgi:pilus assembly protein CpaE